MSTKAQWAMSLSIKQLRRQYKRSLTKAWRVGDKYKNESWFGFWAVRGKGQIEADLDYWRSCVAAIQDELNRRGERK